MVVDISRTYSYGTEGTLLTVNLQVSSIFLRGLILSYQAMLVGMMIAWSLFAAAWFLFLQLLVMWDTDEMKRRLPIQEVVPVTKL